MKSHHVLFAILMVFGACASRPKLYPNETYKRNGKEVAEADIDRCMSEADDYLESPTGKKMVKSGGAGAVIGGAIGAVGGIFTGNVARGAAQGAAMGGAGGAAAGALSPDEVKHRYVNQCLSDKGYQVLGRD